MDVLLLAGGEASMLPAIPASLPDGATLWVDCAWDEAQDWVTPVEGLTGVTIYDDHVADAQNLQHPSCFDSTRLYDRVVFRGLAFRPPEHGPAGGPIRVRTRPTTFFILRSVLVTVRAPDSRTCPALRERLLARPPSGPQPPLPESLMLRLLNAQVDAYMDLRQPLSDQWERWQNELLDPRRPFRDWALLLRARLEARSLEHLCEEQLDALQEWRDERLERYPGHGHGGPFSPLSDALRVRIEDLVGHVERVRRHAQGLERSLESAVQLHFSATAHRTNEIMRTLTTLTAIFLPLTLVTGIFGMNFETIPGLHSPLGFWLTMTGMAALGLSMWLFFRRRRFISGAPFSATDSPGLRAPRAPTRAPTPRRREAPVPPATPAAPAPGTDAAARNGPAEPPSTGPSS